MKHIVRLDTTDGVKKAIEFTIAGKNFQMSDKLEAIVTRYKFINDQYRLYQQLSNADRTEPWKRRRTIVTDIVNTFGVSLKQAYEDYELAKKYFEFGETIDSREVNINIAIENCIEAREIALEGGDMKAVAMIDKNHISLLSKMPEKPPIDWTKVGFNKIRPMFDPTLINSKVTESFEQIRELNKKLIAKYSQKNVTDFYESLAQDIKHEPM